MLVDPEESIGLWYDSVESVMKGVEVRANASSGLMLGGDSALRFKPDVGDETGDGDGDVYPWGWNRVRRGSVGLKLVTRGSILRRKVLLFIKLLKICSRSS